MPNYDLMRLKRKIYILTLSIFGAVLIFSFKFIVNFFWSINSPRISETYRARTSFVGTNIEFEKNHRYSYSGGSCLTGNYDNGFYKITRDTIELRSNYVFAISYSKHMKYASMTGRKFIRLNDTLYSLEGSRINCNLGLPLVNK